MAERDRDGDAPAETEAHSSSFDLLAPESEERADSLRRALRRSKGFSLHVVIADGTARREILRRLRAWSGTGGVPRLHFFDEGEVGAGALERWIAEAWEREALAGAVLSDGDALIANGSALSALNVARDRLGQLLRGPFVVVLSPRSEAEMARIAPDLFDVRAGTWEFEASPVSDRAVEHSWRTFQDKPLPEVSKGDLQASAARLRALGDAGTRPPPGALANAWIRLGHAFFQAHEIGETIEAANQAERHATAAAYNAGVGDALSLKAQALKAAGRLDEAEALLRAAVDRYRRAGDLKRTATALHNLAVTLRDIGRFDEAEKALSAALQLFRDTQDDLRYAAARGSMAEIYRLRGQPEEALRIRREEELPAYKKLGDSHRQAIALKNIAILLAERGHYDEALRICKDEALPIYEKINNAHEIALMWGVIADVLQARRQFEDAVQIYTQKVLPAFEALGDILNRAVTWERMANIRWSSGNLDEAERILREEVLSTFVKSNNTYRILVTQKDLARVLLDRGGPGDREQAAELLRRARASAEQLRARELERIKAIQAQAGFDRSEDSTDPPETDDH